MSFFRGSGDEPTDAEQARDWFRISGGGIPSRAEQRLRELTGGGPFTSTLSVNEFALMSSLGPTALGQVMGASVHQVGRQYLPAEARYGDTFACALDTIQHAWDEARRRAFSRLNEEARLLKADAVIGVKLTRGEHDWARGCVDYVVTGTAIRLPGSDQNNWPVLSDLSVQEYWKLAGAGWKPTGICASTAVRFVSLSRGDRLRQLARTSANAELTDYTRCFTQARNFAVSGLRSQADAAARHGGGLVGVTLEHHIAERSFKTLPFYGYGGSTGGRIGLGSDGGREEREGVVITIQGVGTAIAPAARAVLPPTDAILRAGIGT